MRRSIVGLLKWCTVRQSVPIWNICNAERAASNSNSSYNKSSRRKFRTCMKLCSLRVPCNIWLLLIIALIFITIVPYMRFDPHPMVIIGWLIGQKLPIANASSCTMDLCFDFTACGSSEGDFKFYLYPKDDESKKYDYYYDNNYEAYKRAVEVFNEQYEALSSHPSRTENAEEACLLFPGFDTSSWSPVSNLPSYWRVSKRLRQLSHWKRLGKNHVIFDRHEHDWQPYATDYAIVVRASLHAKYYRPNFDVSYNLQPETKQGSCYITKEDRRKPPSERSTLAFFCGRFTSEVRHTLFDIFSEDDDIVVEHRSKYTERTYCSNLKRSKFGLNPRGIGLVTYRTLELLQAGVIPVFYTDNYILPYSEVLDWRRFAVIIPEYQVHNTRNILNSYSSQEIDSLHKTGVYVYEHFFMNQTLEMNLLIHLLKARIYKNRDILTNLDPLLASKYLYSNPMNLTQT